MREVSWVPRLCVSEDANLENVRDDHRQQSVEDSLDDQSYSLRLGSKAHGGDLSEQSVGACSSGYALRADAQIDEAGKVVL